MFAFPDSRAESASEEDLRFYALCTQGCPVN